MAGQPMSGSGQEELPGDGDLGLNLEDRRMPST